MMEDIAGYYTIMYYHGMFLYMYGGTSVFLVVFSVKPKRNIVSH